MGQERLDSLRFQEVLPFHSLRLRRDVEKLTLVKWRYERIASSDFGKSLLVSLAGIDQDIGISEDRSSLQCKGRRRNRAGPRHPWLKRCPMLGFPHIRSSALSGTTDADAI